MSLPDGAEYWWDIKGKSRASQKGECEVPESRSTELCASCGHTYKRHGRHQIPHPHRDGTLRRTHGGACNHDRTETERTCGCLKFVHQKPKADPMLMTRPPMHALVNCSAHGLTPIHASGIEMLSGIATFGGRVRTSAGVVMLYAGTDARGDPYLIHERFRGRLPKILKRLTEARRRA